MCNLFRLNSIILTVVVVLIRRIIIKEFHRFTVFSLCLTNNWITKEYYFKDTCIWCGCLTTVFTIHYTVDALMSVLSIRSLHL